MSERIGFSMAISKFCNGSANPLVFGKHCLVDSFSVFHIFESRNDECCKSTSKFVHDLLVLPYGRSEISADIEIDIQHHNIVRSRKKTGNISPSVELPVERVNNQVNVDIGSHCIRSGV